METDAVTSTIGSPETEVMGAIEEGTVERFVLADISRDGAYITMPLAEAASLAEWR